MSDQLFDPDTLRDMLTPEVIVDSLVEAMEPLFDAMQLGADAGLRIGLTIGMTIPETLDKTIQAMKEQQ